MARVFINMDCDATERPWSAKNGATRRELVLVNKTGTEIKAGEAFEASLGFLNKGNHSFVFLNPPRGSDDRVLGIFLCADYGYRVVHDPALDDAVKEAKDTLSRLQSDGSLLWDRGETEEGKAAKAALKEAAEERVAEAERARTAVLAAQELYTASSVGGYGNSESRFGIYVPGTVIATASYKGRRGETFFKLNPEKGWVNLGADCALDDSEIIAV